VLTNTVLTEKYHTASLTKKCHSQKSITPIHLACTNPNLAIIKKLMEQSSDVNVCDTQNHKPLHFAAGCESVAPLEYLLTLGANPYDLNLRKRSALHFAALAGRPHNITALLAARPEIWKIRDSMNMSAFGYACESGRADCILAFLDTKVVKAGAG
jgi:ankyrin repeat protein